MVLGRVFSSIRSRLGRRPESGAALFALRAFGKLALDKEYIVVGCDGAAAEAFRTWISEGCKWWETVFAKDPVRVRRHRLLLTVDAGRAWIVACLWDSGDQPSEQGSQRNFPFGLFVVVPSSDYGRSVSMAAGSCGLLWDQIEQAYPTLITAADRGECGRQISQHRISLPGERSAFENQLVARAGRIALNAWLADVMGPGVPSEHLFLGLQQRLIAYRGTGGKEPTAWRLPLGESIDPLVQVSCWLQWLDLNLGARAADVAIFWPMEQTNGRRELCVVTRPVRPSDFAGLSVDAEHVDRALGPGLVLGGPIRNRQDGFLQIVASDLPVGRRSLADFAQYGLPRPRPGVR